MLWRLVAVMVLANGIWSGFDGLRVNFTSPEITEIFMRELEQNGIGDSRWLRVSFATPGDQFAYNYSEKTKMVSSILYPIYDPFRLVPEILDVPVGTDFGEGFLDSLVNEHEDEFGTAFAIVKDDVPAGVHQSDLERYWSDYSQEDAFEGIVSVGWDGPSDEDVALLTSNGIDLVDDFVFITLGTSPRSAILNSIIMLGSVGLLMFGIVAQFRRKPGSLPDPSRIP